VYGTEDKSDKGLTAAVIARSAGVGENYKKICTCDGTTIWESSNNDFVAGKVWYSSIQVYPTQVSLCLFYSVHCIWAQTFVV